jgi:hypothetical protein
MLRKNVSISDEHLRLLDPLLKKHKGNLSAAMRDIIDFTGFITENLGSLETAKDLLKEKNYSREQTLNRIYGITIPITMFNWFLINRKSFFPHLSDTMQIFSSDLDIDDATVMNKRFNEQLSCMNWPVTVVVSNENGLTIQITGIDPEINRFSAILIAMFLAGNKNNHHRINGVLTFPSSISMQMVIAHNIEEAMYSIYQHFYQEIIDNKHEFDLMMIKKDQYK